MKILDDLLHRVVFSDHDGAGGASRYNRMWRNTVLVVAAVSLIPLAAMTAVNYYQFQRTFKDEISHPLQRLTSVSKKSLESFLEERIAVLRYVVKTETFEDLTDREHLAGIFSKMRTSFGGFVDLGVIDEDGLQRSYAGPYDLAGKQYSDQDWFGEVASRGVYVSDVLLGHRKLPHFVIAVREELSPYSFYVFRATIDTEAFNKRILSVGLKQVTDLFIINDKGVLQTPSRLFGNVLEKAPIVLPPYTEDAELVENFDIYGSTYLLGYAGIKGSPFIFVVLARSEDLMKGWLTIRTEFIGFLALSMMLILILIMNITSNWVKRLKETDLRRAALLHNTEHTNKMASIGRLAAGVAHEINNPLAIINEKAGLMKDLIGVDPEMRNRDKMIRQADSILNSVKRCSEITHRLLGFAKHMDLRTEPIALDALIREVLGFLEKEASFRNIRVKLEVAENMPTIESDRGRLQQLFLNLINNAFDAMGETGVLDIVIRRRDENHMEVSIADDGIGISKEHLEHVFEPFYTTKKQGTGLGLSISYGIVEKLGGAISVESEPGRGTKFTIILPITHG